MFWVLIFLPFINSAQYNFLSKKVSVQVDSVEIDFALDILAKKCDCYFTYNAELINGDKLISIKLENVSLKKALDTLINEPNLLFTEYKNQVVISSEKFQNSDPILTSDTSEILIKGKVIDKQTLKALPFASVAINKTFLGTICNENGIFALKIPRQLRFDTLLVSYVGYYTTKIPVIDFNSFLNVELLEGIVSIQEVVVRNADPKFILKKALERIEINYENKPFNYDAFYREAIKKENKYSMYTEAVLFGYKPKLHTTAKTDKVQVLQSRKFSNSVSKDTVAVRVSSGLASCFSLDIVDDFPVFLSEDRNDIYDYTLTDIVVWDESLVYCIEFKPKNYIHESLPEGLLYISINDYAIVGSEFKFTEEKIKNQSSSFILRKSRKIRARPKGSRYFVRYKKQGDKYYLNHVRGELIINVKQKRKVFSKDYTVLIEMVITNINKYNVRQKLEKDKLVKINSIFSESQFIYEINIWGNNNIIEPEDNIIKAFEKTSLKVTESNDL